MTSFPGAGLARRRSSARCQAPASASRRRSSADWPASIIGTTGTAAGTVARCQVNDDQLARRQLPGCRSTGTATRANRRDRGDRGTMTSFPGAGLARRRSSARCQAPASASRRRSSAHLPASIVTTGTAAGTVARCQVNDDQLARRQLPGCRSTGTATRANRRDRGDRGTMTSFPGAGLARRRSSARCQAPASASRRRSSADWPASIIGTTRKGCPVRGTIRGKPRPRCLLFAPCTAVFAP